MYKQSVDEAFMTRLLDGCAALLQDGDEDLAPSRPDQLISCLRACYSLGFQTDDLRFLHAEVRKKVREAAASPDREDALLFPAVCLCAEGFQLQHRGSLHAHAVGAIIASICKLPYVDALGGKPREVRLTLREELYHGADTLLMNVLDQEGLAFFAASPAPEESAAFLRSKLGPSAPNDHPALHSLCAGACVLSAFHLEGKRRQAVLLPPREAGPYMKASTLNPFFDKCSI